MSKPLLFLNRTYAFIWGVAAAILEGAIDVLVVFWSDRKRFELPNGRGCTVTDSVGGEAFRRILNPYAFVENLGFPTEFRGSVSVVLRARSLLACAIPVLPPQRGRIEGR